MGVACDKQDNSKCPVVETHILCQCCCVNIQAYPYISSLLLLSWAVANISSVVAAMGIRCTPSLNISAKQTFHNNNWSHGFSRVGDG
jgi:hypothetical protein